MAVLVGMGYTVLAREYIIDGLRAANKDIMVSNLRGDATKTKTKAKQKTKGKRKRRY